MRNPILIALALVTATSAANITYNVVSLTNGTRSMGVLVDNQIYPLYASEKSSILHTGSAPVATQGYNYAVLEGDDIINSENFTRAPIESDTVNEHYNRSWNKWELDKLPVVLPPLPIINRIDSDLHIDGEIPTIHFVGNQTEIDYLHANQASDTIEVSVKMTYISPNTVKKIEDVTLQISGGSTRMFPKLSYKLKTPKDDDLFGYRSFKLRAIASLDFSYMKEFLGYDMYNSVGLPTTKFSYVRLYINDNPIGLFGIAENYKNPWMRNEFANGDKNYKQGAFYAAAISGGISINSTDESEKFPNNTGSDLTYLGNNVSLYSKGYYNVKEDPSKGKANFTRIMDLTKFISEASNTTTDNSVVPLWEEKMDVDSFLRGMAMEILISNPDGYFVNGNNYLLYDDLEHERLVFSGSDFDLAMGMQSVNHTMDGNYSKFPKFNERPLSKMLNVPQFKEEFENLLVNITRDLINPEILIPRIDQIYQMLQDDVAWDKSLPKMGHLNMPDLFSKAQSRAGNTDMPVQASNISQSELDNMMYSLLSFDGAVNGPISGPYLGIIIPLKDWVRIRSENILNFFNQTA